MDRFGSVMRANCVQLLLCERARLVGTFFVVIPAEAGIQLLVQSVHDVQKKWMTSHPAVKTPAFAGMTIMVMTLRKLHARSEHSIRAIGNAESAFELSRAIARC